MVKTQVALVRLEHNGHGNLHGIPGFVYDTATGEDLASL